MKTTMRQIVMEGPGKSRVMEVPVPQIGKGELLVRVTLSGICHSELYPWMTAKKGDTLGHESVGIVEKVGEGVSSPWPEKEQEKTSPPRDHAKADAKGCGRGRCRLVKF